MAMATAQRLSVDLPTGSLGVGIQEQPHTGRCIVTETNVGGAASSPLALRDIIVSLNGTRLVDVEGGLDAWVKMFVELQGVERTLTVLRSLEGAKGAGDAGLAVSPNEPPAPASIPSADPGGSGSWTNYRSGIIVAISALKDCMGSSSIAIKKYMQANMPRDRKWINRMYLNQLKKASEDGTLMQIKGKYKLSRAYKDAGKAEQHRQKSATKEKNRHPSSTAHAAMRQCQHQSQYQAATAAYTSENESADDRELTREKAGAYEDGIVAALADLRDRGASRAGPIGRVDIRDKLMSMFINKDAEAERVAWSHYRFNSTLERMVKDGNIRQAGGDRYALPDRAAGGGEGSFASGEPVASGNAPIEEPAADVRRVPEASAVSGDGERPIASGTSAARWDDEGKVTVVVNKPSKACKLGLGIRQEEGYVEVISIAPGSVFDGTDLSVGLALESINGIEVATISKTTALLKETEGQVIVVAGGRTRTVQLAGQDRFSRDADANMTAGQNEGCWRDCGDSTGWKETTRELPRKLHSATACTTMNTNGAATSIKPPVRVSLSPTNAIDPLPFIVNESASDVYGGRHLDDATLSKGTMAPAPGSTYATITVTKPFKDFSLGICLRQQAGAVRVTSLSSTSLFLQTGLKAGIALKTINGIKVTSAEHAAALLRAVEGRVTIVAS